MRHALLTPLLALVAFPAHADALQDRLAAQARATGDGFAFRRTVSTTATGQSPSVAVYDYNPRRPASERLTLLSLNGTPATAEQVAKARRRAQPFVGYGELAKWIASPATRTQSRPGQVTYRFTQLPAGTLRLNDHDASAQSTAEAVVNTAGPVPFVETVRIASSKPFRMMMVARVDTLAVTRHYRLAANGVPMIERTDTVMTGSMLGRAGQMVTRVVYSDVRPVG